ncbi:type II restriction enzyme [Streptococcus uberis]|uniref:type II restriction enzyme n=1 Tax=Streptococcus uberis TaxID=1349 RepID=UPI001FF358F9|nr:type II restriction endonuclease [Streptococcus uberis]MCK1213509.1 type II restriction endonuclease [Streptococcus uberis]
MKKISASEAWEILLNRYNILEEVKVNGLYKIKSSTIKEVKEPRLMAKWDSSEQLPSSLKENGLNILPDSRSSYVISDFLLYEKIPTELEIIKNMSKVDLPDLESINIEEITSEANAINVLQISGILEDFLELNSVDQLFATFNGRMSSGKFNFKVNTKRNTAIEINVDRAQIEIDGGFESEECIIILEAKNVLHEDFHIRQLYYPFRTWKSKVQKPIRLIFSVYTNKIFRMMEYRFKEVENYSSIELVKMKNYSLEDTSISIEELIKVHKSIDTNKINSDALKTVDVPFVQADSFERIISLLENMNVDSMTGEEIENLMEFTSRQRDYYFNAGKYLGLFEKFKEDKIIHYKLTEQGLKVFRQNYKNRQLLLVRLILNHQIFYDLFEWTIENGKLPSKHKVIELELKYDVCKESVAARRASTVISWLGWIFNLPNL